MTFLCALDGGAASACTTGKTYTGLADGAHTFAVTAVDAAGNTSTATSATPWTVDSTSPVNTATFPVSGTTYSAATYNAGCSTGGGDLCGTTSDAVTSVSQVRVSIQQVSGASTGTAPASRPPPRACARRPAPPRGRWRWPLASMADGSYTVRTYATDAAGNVSTTTTTFTMDTTPPPVPTIRVFPSGTTTVVDRELHVQRHRGGSDVPVLMDGGTAVACTSPTVYRALSNASHTFSVTATDAARQHQRRGDQDLDHQRSGSGRRADLPGQQRHLQRHDVERGLHDRRPATSVGLRPRGTTAVALSIKQVSTGLYWNGHCLHRLRPRPSSTRPAPPRGATR